MRILLAHNMVYYPAFGGAEKSNRLLMESLARRGHTCQVVARIANFGSREHEAYLAELGARGVRPTGTAKGAVTFRHRGVDVHVVTNTNLPAYFADQIGALAPDVILVSSDDPAQRLLKVALQARQPRIVYLARATPALPFGPDCSFANDALTRRIAATDAVVGVSEYVASYIRRHADIEAVHVPISFPETHDWPCLGSFDNELVTLVNPCALKGISIFLALADAFPHVAFAAVPTWGTNQEDRAALAARANIRVLPRVDDINDVLRRTRIVLVPSLWAEARGRIVVDAMLAGVPVLASQIGGIGEAMLGVPYLLPVRPIRRYQRRVDDQMVPVADVPPQDISPWCEALQRLISNRQHYDAISRAAHVAAVRYARTLSVEPLEALLQSVLARDRSAPFRDPMSVASLALS